MELVLEQTQQGTSYEVSVSAEGVEELKRKVKIKGEKKEALLILRQRGKRRRSDTGSYICCQEYKLKMEILLEPTSNKLMVAIELTIDEEQRFDTSARNPVKETLLKLNLPDHKPILTDLKIEVKVQSSKILLDKERMTSQYHGTRFEELGTYGKPLLYAIDGEICTSHGDKHMLSRHRSSSEYSAMTENFMEQCRVEVEDPLAVNFLFR
ncbi:hypothetical protein Tco_1262232 [Tanacetum coccineum]